MKKFDPNAIRVLGMSKGMSLEAFGKSLQPPASRQLVSQWETATQVPDTDSLLRIVNAHNVPFEIFFVESEYHDGNHAA
jgi:DNA-binding transcriptional regulator YiaG